MRKEVNHIIDRLCRALRGRYGEQLVEVILFGSQARNEATMESDIDVLVVLENLQMDPFLEYQNWGDWVVEILLEDQELVNLVFTSRERFDEVNTPLYRNIHLEGIVLYGRRDSMVSNY